MGEAAAGGIDTSARARAIARTLVRRTVAPAGVVAITSIRGRALAAVLVRLVMAGAGVPMLADA